VRRHLEARDFRHLELDVAVDEVVVITPPIARAYSTASSRVSARDSDLIAGAASKTTGNIVTQAISQDTSQFRKKWPLSSEGKLAMPAAIREVKPDWITPKTKWVWRRGMWSIGEIPGRTDAIKSKEHAEVEAGVWHRHQKGALRSAPFLFIS
jgi:hypothetical protein